MSEVSLAYDTHCNLFLILYYNAHMRVRITENGDSQKYSLLLIFLCYVFLTPNKETFE